MKISNQEFVSSIMSFVGVPWRLHGRSRSGVDCAGLAVMAYRECGGEIGDRMDYDARMPDPKKLVEIVQAACEPCAQPHLGPGKLLLTRWGDKPSPRHVCLTVSDGMIVHCDAKLRRVVCQPVALILNDIVGAFNFREVDYGDSKPW
jgi:cell wall-associated NlpC family hydrolase